MSNSFEMGRDDVR